VDTRRSSGLRLLVLIGDAALVVASMGAAFGGHGLLRAVIPQLRAPPAVQEYAAVAYLALPLWLALVVGLGLHRVFERPWTRLQLFGALVRLHALGLVGLGLALFITQSTINRSIVAVFMAASFTLLYAERLVILAWVRHQRRTGGSVTRILVVGDASPSLSRFLRRAADEPFAPHVLGRLGGAVEAEDGLPARLGSPEDLAACLAREAVDEVVFFPPCEDPRGMRDALETCETLGVPASFALDTEPLKGMVPTVRRMHDVAVLTFEVSPKPPLELAIKHAIDVVLAAVGLVVVAPILLAAAAAILVTMGRPIFFVQKRAGLRGREFAMLKLRTMVRDAEARKSELASRNEMTGPVFKVADDPRVTRLGRLLRRTSIDELPQLFHVLTGTMSLVGPRPLPVREQQQIHGWHRRRLAMKPGITCLWQISGRNDVDFEEWMALDLRYVDEWSLAGDARILLLTIPVVLARRGAR
jgi:exopolysaccharide biosynthesis polyprenyl glycosylphosphotransferase